MKILFSLFPKYQKFFEIVMVIGALACGVLGGFFISPADRGPYTVMTIFILLAFVIIYLLEIKKFRQERALANKRTLLSWTASDNTFIKDNVSQNAPLKNISATNSPVKDQLYLYGLNKLLISRLIMGIITVILIALSVFLTTNSVLMICLIGIYSAVNALLLFVNDARNKLFPANEFTLCDHQLIHFGSAVYINGISSGIYNIAFDREESILFIDLFIKANTFKLSVQVPDGYAESTVQFLDGLQAHFESLKSQNAHETNNTEN